MPPKQKSYDYEAFVPQLKRHRCIWDIKHDNYSLSDYRSVAFERIEWNMGIEREFRLHNVFTSTLDLDKNVILASGHDEPTIYT